jgi:hypothetical protein
VSSPTLALKASGGLLVLALAVSACGGSSGGSTAATQSTPTSSSSSSTTDASATQAATLRAGLDGLLREHVDLTGFAVQTAATSGVSSANTKQALATVAANTKALGAAIGSVYGASAEKKFDKLWTAHIGFFVNYTIGLASHDKAKVAAAQRNLSTYRQQFSAFIHTATGLPASAVASDLQGHVQTLETAIRSILAKSPSAAADLQMAAMHMDGTADALAKGIATQQNLPGNVDGDGSALRSGLTGLFIQHVAQTVDVVQTAVGTNLSSAQTKAALKALDQNTVALGSAIGSLYGHSAQQAFLKMWRAHIGFFVTYTSGLATHNQADVKKGNRQLATYQKQFGEFLGSATGLPATAVSADLQGHVQTLEAAIRAIVSQKPNAAHAVAMAESHMAGTAAVLGSGISKQKNLS